MVSWGGALRPLPRPAAPFLRASEDYWSLLQLRVICPCRRRHRRSGPHCAREASAFPASALTRGRRARACAAQEGHEQGPPDRRVREPSTGPWAGAGMSLAPLQPH